MIWLLYTIRNTTKISVFIIFLKIYFLNLKLINIVLDEKYSYGAQFLDPIRLVV